MKKIILGLFAASFISVHGFAQCTTTNAKTCVCPPGGGIDCDLLPDIKVSVDALQSSYTVYTQSGNAASGTQGSNDGRLRLTGTTPNIGYGPLETRSINKWLCGTDTLFTNPGTLCPDGKVPKRFVVQRIYHKSDSIMTYTEVPCGTMTYHPSHGHMHVDNWGVYTLRIQNPNDPDPTHWSIVGAGTKLAFCLLDIASCDNGNGIYCRDDNNVPKLSAQIPNHTIGNGSYGCSSTLQGISNGWYDSYSSSLDGMWIDIPPGTCNGNYYVVVQIDPNQNMVELNENNNVIAVPVTLANQSSPGSPVVTISANKPGTLLPGESVTLTATAGTAYSWSPGGATTQGITVNSAGSYTCTVTNYCGTATSSPFVVSVLPSAPVPVTTGASICGGSSATLTANGGTGTMKWYDSPTATLPLATGSSYTTPVLTNTTTYYVENEVSTTGATVHVGPLTNTIGTGAYQTTTPSNTWYLQFDAVSDITLQTVKIYASTTGSRTFILQDRASTQLKSQTINIPSTGANVITLNWNIPAGEGYKIMVSGTPNLYYNTSGVSYPYHVPGICKITGTYSGHTNYTFFYDMVVNTPDQVAKSGMVPVTATITNTITVNGSASQNSICQGESVTLSATGATTYTWNPGGLSGSSVTVTPSSSTTYSVTGTTAGCTGTANVSITVTPIPVVSISGPVSICNGSSATLTASGAGSYIWSTGATTASINVSPIINTNYSVTGITAGCTGSNSTSIVVNPNAVVSISGAGSICAGSSATLIASGASTFLWSTGATTASIVVSPSVNTNYSVTGTSSGCNGTNSAQINVNPNPVVSISGPSGICNGSSAILTASGAASYLWSTGATTASINVSPSVITTYSVTGTAAGCTGSNSSTISVNPNPVVSISGAGSICSGSSVTLIASGAASFLWSTGATTASINVSPTINTTYSVTGTTAGCTGANSTSIVVNPRPSVNISNTGVSCFAGTNGTATAIVTGGTPGYNYSWNTIPVQTSSTATGLAAGTYTVNISDANGCTAVNSQTVNQPSLLTGSAIVTNTSCGGINGSINLTPSGGTIPYSYVWTPGGASSQDLSGIGSATYTVLITDANGCTISQSYSVGANTSAPAPPAAINGAAYVCKGTTGNQFTVLPVVGASSYTWSVPPGATITSGQGTSSLTLSFSSNQNSGNICVYASNSCGNSANVCKALTVVTSKPAVPASISGPGTVCPNTSGIAFSCPVVAKAETYNWSLPVGLSFASGAGTNNITVNAASNFAGGFIRVSAGNCKGTSGLKSLQLYSLPAMPGTITGSSTVCANQTGVTYSVAAVPAATSYSWTLPAGAIITSGSGTNSITITYGSASGTIAVRAVNTCGQSNARNLAVNISCRFAAPRLNFTMYPNPAQKEVTISFSTVNDSKYQLSIYDITGRRISEISGAAVQGINEISLDVSAYVKGVYVISYEEKNVRIIKKLIVE
jgi:hypothetical protein